MVRSSAGGSPRTKPITRSSIRQSLGRAFADVINKEGKDSDKATKKIKDARRLSALNLKPAAPRDSMGEARPQTQPVKRTGTPDSVTLTRKRLSITVQRPLVDEQSSKSNETTPREGAVTRSAALRPSSRQNAISALPKYRLKSETAQQPPSPPPRITTRRRLRTSEDEKEEKQNSKEPATPQSSQKGTRPISPLPLRALRNGSPSNSTPPSTPSRHQPATPSSAKSSPTVSSRPPKAVKTATSSVASQAVVTRESSSSSSSTSGTPRTPKINLTKATARRADQENVRQKSSSAASSPQRSSSESPVAHRQLRNVVDLTYDSPMSHISEATSEEEDVALLLAPVADPTAPTPAMPRLGKTRSRDRQLPKTPSRPGNTLPSRSQMSYLSPLPPTDSSPSRLRSQSKTPDDRMFRASILSWEQVANEASKTLGEDEIHSMLSDVPAPFSAQISPSISSNGMDIPDSPCLSVLNSPGAFGSISQVLLPDMTPSPAVHHNAFKYAAKNDLGSADGATVTLLKLQLVAAENMAKERLSRLLMLEDEMHNLKEEHKHETSELSMQISRMQDQLCEKEEYEDRLARERAAHTALLQDKIRNAQILQEKAVQEGITRYKERERSARKVEYRQWHVAMSATCAASVAHTGWGSVRDLSEAELETVKGDRQLLSVMLAELDRLALLVN